MRASAVFNDSCSGSFLFLVVSFLFAACVLVNGSCSSQAFLRKEILISIRLPDSIKNVPDSTIFSLCLSLLQL